MMNIRLTQSRHKLGYNSTETWMNATRNYILIAILNSSYNRKLAVSINQAGNGNDLYFKACMHQCFSLLLQRRLIEINK